MSTAYSIVTPAYNEGRYIESTIKGVIAQSVRPRLWCIVDDGSADNTAEIIRDFAARHAWIKYIYRAKQAGQSYYGSNVYAILEGIKSIDMTACGYLAILDADIALPPDYYERIIGYLDADSRLGIVSGVYQDNVNGRLRKMLNDRRSTPKALMVFRKACFDDIGGLLPMRYGGEDTVACFTARMKGWKTWSFPDLVAIHNKPIGTGHAAGFLKIRFRQGVGEYFLAAHPLFVAIKSLRRCIKEPPFMIGGAVRMIGFIYAHFLRQPRQLPPHLVRYIRSEQLSRVFRGNAIPDEFSVEISPNCDQLMNQLRGQKEYTDVKNKN